MVLCVCVHVQLLSTAAWLQALTQNLPVTDMQSHGSGLQNLRVCMKTMPGNPKDWDAAAYRPDRTGPQAVRSGTNTILTWSSSHCAITGRADRIQHTATWQMPIYTKEWQINEKSSSVWQHVCCCTTAQLHKRPVVVTSQQVLVWSVLTLDGI